jgi:hypothetical protein
VVTKTYQATWVQTYASNGTQVSWFPGAAYQGNYDSSVGDLRALIGFDYAQIAADVGPGGTITAVSVTAFKEYGAAPTGPTAQWGMHSYDSKPTTWNAANVWARAWPRATNVPANDMPSWDLDASDIDDTIKNGTFKGLAFGPVNSTNTSLVFGLSRWLDDETTGMTITYTPAYSGAASLSAGADLAATAVSGPNSSASLAAQASATADAYNQPPTVSLDFAALSGGSIAAQAQGGTAMRFDAVATAAPIGALYLRQWGLLVPEGG